MKVKVLQQYLDSELDRVVKEGEILEVSPIRYKEMIQRAECLDGEFFKRVEERNTQKK